MGLQGKGRLLGFALGALLAVGAIGGCAFGSLSKDEIEVGANFEMSGNFANYGTSGFDGFKFAIKQANDAGGIRGKKIHVIGIDDRSNADDTIAVTKKLISDYHVKVLVGPMTSNLVLAESKVATQEKIPVLAPAATSHSVTQNNDGSVKPYIFRSCFTNAQEADSLARFALRDLHAKTASIIVESGSEYATDLAQTFKHQFEAGGGEILAQETFMPDAKDFSTMLSKIKAANANVIFLPAYYTQVGKIVKQARAMGINVTMLGPGSWDEEAVVDIAGADALNNTYFCTHYDETDPNAQGFINAFSAEYGHAPNVFTALGYDAGQVLVDALKRANSDDPEKIRQALEETKNLQLSTGTITIDEHHNSIKSAVIMAMKNGVKELRAKIAPQKEE